MKKLALGVVVGLVVVLSWPGQEAPAETSATALETVETVQVGLFARRCASGNCATSSTSVSFVPGPDATETEATSTERRGVMARLRARPRIRRLVGRIFGWRNSGR